MPLPWLCFAQTMPATACGTPSPSLYARFNGITIGLAAFLLYMGVMWAGCRWLMRTRDRPGGAGKWSDEEIVEYNRLTIQRFVFVLNVAFTPATETILSIFDCREINGLWYQTEDMKTLCYTGAHKTYIGLAVLWGIIFILGIPSLFAVRHFHSSL